MNRDGLLFLGIGALSLAAGLGLLILAWSSRAGGLSLVKRRRRAAGLWKKALAAKRLPGPAGGIGWVLAAAAALLPGARAGEPLMALAHVLCIYMAYDTLRALGQGRTTMALLKQQLHLNDLVRAKYHESGMADEAVYDACLELEPSEWAIREQGERIYEVLAAVDVEQALFEYHESAPNRYLKLLLSLVHLTMEFGDARVEGQSVLVRNLSYLSDEIRLEIAKRDRLNYGLKSLNAIVLMPLVAMWPVGSWAGKHFEPLKAVYEGPTGYLLACLTIAGTAFCYILLRRIQRVDEERRMPKPGAGRRLTGLNRLVENLVDRRSARWQMKRQRLLKESLSVMTVRELALRQTLTGLLLGAGMLVLLGGWREPLAVAAAMLLGYWWPVLGIRLDARLYKREAETELQGLMAIILLLMHHERMSVEDVVEWMEMYAAFAKEPLQRCLHEMAAGEEEALDRLDGAVAQEDFSRIVGKLKQAAADLTLAQAFDEMEREKRFFYEMRREQARRLVERKMSLGKAVGFIPMHLLVIAYAAVPMLLVSLQEMDNYFNTLV